MGGMSGMRGERRALLDPVIWQGPPEAAEMARLATLSETQRTAYDSTRLRFMRETRPPRDSLGAYLSMMRAGGRFGDPSEMRDNMGIVRDLEKRLTESQKSFDETLRKELLTKDQWKQYEKWRKSRREDMERGRGPEDRRGGQEPQGA